ncbi:argininosuccinate synthase [candidate division WOR-3 bacterium]|nr:argininosuccinate synthase [candidate division WOR-3 bacterium]
MGKVVLAYSGGLDTSVLIAMLREKYNAQVIAVTIDLGQHEDLAAIKDKARSIGAVDAFTIDAREEFAHKYIVPSLQANALYENVYPLATALGRPLIADKLIQVAHAVNATSIAHGCTGKGNDQVRIESALAYLDPSIHILAPVREFSLSRDYELKYAQEHAIPVEKAASTFSIDENLWGRSAECGALEQEDCEPPEQAFAWTQSPLDAPNYSAYCELTFEHGVPIAFNGKRMALVDLIQELNRIGGLHSIGRIDHIESRLVGIKSREVYEAPAAKILIQAHQDLEKLVLTRDVLHFKPVIEHTFADCVYNGLWFSPLRQALSGFTTQIQENITGTVKMRLYKGSAIVIGRTAEKGLYVKDLATYEGADEFDSRAAKGFIQIWSLPYKVYSIKNNGHSARALPDLPVAVDSTAI